jgi:long-chain fatty acid transport protein
MIVCPLVAHASFIESTLGTAVVNDATASYYNPAALTLLKNSQIIAQGSEGFYENRFTGQSVQRVTNITQSGTSSTRSNYFLPAIYMGMPATDKMTVGFAVVSNFLNKNLEDNSILRYVESSNTIRDIDLVPAIGMKLNEAFSVGAGLNLSAARFDSQPTSGFPSLNVPDTESRNESNATGLGGSLGVLLKPSPTTLIGLNYRTAVTYRFSGKSTLESNPEVISNHYNFEFWTPARTVLSINQFVSSRGGFIGTIQRIQWSIFKNVNINGIATQVGSQPSIVNASFPYHMHDTWLFTLGSYCRLSPKWIVRIAGSYSQSPGNEFYQITNGDSIVVGASVAYQISKKYQIDGSYAHAFIQDKNIHIATTRNNIDGVNKGNLDAVSLKLTVNLS